jgi:hypothetical protein
MEKVISENGIVSEDIYNFDETGFAMGQPYINSTGYITIRVLWKKAYFITWKSRVGYCY